MERTFDEDEAEEFPRSRSVWGKWTGVCAPMARFLAVMVHTARPQRANLDQLEQT
jgi:hypothetical protein